MKLVAAKCPNCGANIDVDKDSDSTKCEFCKSKIIVDDAIAKYKVEISGKVEVKNLPKIENHMKLGNRHFDDKEYEDAFKQYEKACELDPDNSKAVLRKGLSKSYSTGYSNFDIKSAGNSMKNAYKILKESKADQETINKYIVECYTLVDIKQNEIVNFYKSNNTLNRKDLELVNSRLKMCLEEFQYLKGIVEDNKVLKINILKSITTCCDFILRYKLYPQTDRQGKTTYIRYIDSNENLIRQTQNAATQEIFELDPVAKEKYETEMAQKAQMEKTTMIIVASMFGLILIIGLIGTVIAYLIGPDYLGKWNSDSMTIELKIDYTALVSYKDGTILEYTYNPKCNSTKDKCIIEIKENDEIKMTIKYEKPSYTEDEDTPPTFCTEEQNKCVISFTKNEE